jgi:phosphatidylserine/phosphatidylglycerophosphate/cardiolipin synthase-like enzyme
MKVVASKGPLKVVAWRGDAKTLLAFDLSTAASRKNLAGFTIQIVPPGVPAYWLHNYLRFERPEKHAQDPAESAFSSINAPIHKFRWIHVPGSVHQGLEPAFGENEYRITPRYFGANKAMLPLDPARTVPVKIDVSPFKKGPVTVAFTRGFTQSQAFTHHFGNTAKIRPPGDDLQFDTTQICGTNAAGESFTYEQQYEWSGFTARKRVFELLDEAIADASVNVRLFAYDLNEPDIVGRLLTLGAAGRIRIVLDNAALHHDSAGSTPEDAFSKLFTQAAGNAALLRGKFSRYAHDKVIVLERHGAPYRVLTGSTNFSVTGMYVNSNHVVVFDDANVARTYADVFDAVWAAKAKADAFRADPLSRQAHTYAAPLDGVSINFSPHTPADAAKVLDRIVKRVNAEKNVSGGKGSVLFAVMLLAGGKAENPVYDALKKLHATAGLFSFGVSDTPDGIALYPLGRKTGVLVTGKPVKTQLPPPFNQVKGVSGHQIHHKFVVCGFNGADPTVFCGSSNLALGGEQDNGDNLLEIHDEDIATVFAIEALGLVDHFNFLDGTSTGNKPAKPAANKSSAAAKAGWWLSVGDGWARKFFDAGDLHSIDRKLFVG